MKNLYNKKILLIICGGISAYKSLELIRLLNAVESEHVRIDKSILWTYPVENEWVLSANKKETQCIKMLRLDASQIYTFITHGASPVFYERNY